VQHARGSWSVSSWFPAERGCTGADCGIAAAGLRAGRAQAWRHAGDRHRGRLDRRQSRSAHLQLALLGRGRGHDLQYAGRGAWAGERVAPRAGEILGWYLFREILPNAAPTLIAEFGIRIAYAVLFISGLSFLGVGVQPPAADLGGLVRENALAISVGQLAPLAPAVCIALITLSVNGIVDWFIHKYSIRAELG